MAPFFETKNLVKHYNSVKAVNGVSFTLTQGTCFGLLGPNGAGKTTTMEMLEGIKPYTSGEILYKGRPLDEQFRHESGIMFQATALQDYITVHEILNLFHQFYDKTLSVKNLIEICSLGEFLDRDTRKLSGGQRQRLLLAIALINDPDIIFLDEPTAGLDPQARRNFWALVHDIKARGKTIVITTHYMEEAHNLCDEVGIMDNGKIIAQGTPTALLAEHFAEVLVQLPEADVPRNADTLTIPMIRRSGMVEILSNDVNATIRQLMTAGASLADIHIRPRTLEDLFLELTGKELRS